jgi:predicted N-formylglutamate amidohydrolase
MKYVNMIALILIIVGDNEPYSGRLKGDCMWTHGTKRGLPHALIEVRNDLISEEAGRRAWGARLADAVTDALAAMRRAA